MAKTLDLRRYQEGILDRMKELAQSSSAGSTSRLGVRVGEELLLVPLDDISEVLPVPEMEPVPLTRPWFLGMANVRGNLYGVNDMAQLAGHPATVQGLDSRILLVHQKYAGNVALLVGELLGLRNLEQMQEESTPPVAEQPWINGRVFRDMDGKSWHEFSVPELLNCPGFNKVGVV